MTQEYPRISQGRSIKAGFKRKCPRCEQGSIFAGYLKLADKCSHCDAPIGEIRADDFPPYLTIIIVGHIILPALLFVEVTYHPSTLFQMILWPTVAMAMSLSLLPVLKGAVVGFMWSMGMKGTEQH